MASPPRPYQKRSRLTKLQALQICERRRQVLTTMYKELAAWAHVEFSLATRPSKQTIGHALKSESQLRCTTADCLMRQRGRSSFQLVLDQCMIEFVVASESWGISLSCSMLIAQARKALQRLNVPPAAWPRLGRSWLRNFQDRYGIRWRRAHGEDGLVDLEAVEEEVAELRRIIRTYSYTDVYNMHETGFFFNNVPRGSLYVNNAPALKQDKARITLALYTNTTGTDKLPLLFIGKSVKPRWLAKKPADVQYTSAPRAWMTSTTFQDWLRGVDRSMRVQHRRILLLVDNASSHCDDGLALTNVRIAKLPPNTTSKLQPLDQGIIYCVKREVLRKKMEHALNRIDEGEENPYKVDMLKGIEWCAEARQQLSAETIQHCWLHSTLISKADMNLVLQ